MIKQFKIAFVSLFLLGISNITAQVTTGDIGRQAAEADVTNLGTADTYIRVIDNKGTQKFLQAQNGVTMFTDTAPNGGIVTTWQLGGTLDNNTYIDVAGNAFSIDGLALETGVASTDAVDLSVSNPDNTAGVAVGTATGWTVLVRDEATGETRKLLATDLLQSGTTVETAATDTLTGTFTIAAPGLPDDASRVWVYRNGAKLISGTDYAAAADTVTLTVNTTAGTASWVSFTGDVYEIQWVK